MKRKKNYGQVILHAVFLVLVAVYLIPFIMVISVSLTDETEIIQNGYSLIPKAFSTFAYELVFRDMSQMVQAYGVTMFFSVVSTLLSTLVVAMLAYPLSRSNFLWKDQLNFYVYFTMLFGGGLVPTYIVVRNWLHLYNTIWVYILPGLVSAYNVMIIRTNYKSLPIELTESAKLDGASELDICFRIIVPLSKAGLASVAFLFFVGKWNDWMTTTLYIDDLNLYSLQYLLQRLIREADFLKNAAQTMYVPSDVVMPTETLRFAMALVAAGPVLVVFPVFQKYFAKGMTIGGVKG